MVRAFNSQMTYCDRSFTYTSKSLVKRDTKQTVTARASAKRASPCRSEHISKALGENAAGSSTHARKILHCTVLWTEREKNYIVLCCQHGVSRHASCFVAGMWPGSYTQGMPQQTHLVRAADFSAKAYCGAVPSCKLWNVNSGVGGRSLKTSVPIYLWNWVQAAAPGYPCLRQAVVAVQVRHWLSCCGRVECCSSAFCFRSVKSVNDPYSLAGPKHGRGHA